MANCATCNGTKKVCNLCGESGEDVCFPADCEACKTAPTLLEGSSWAQIANSGLLTGETE